MREPVHTWGLALLDSTAGVWALTHTHTWHLCTQNMHGVCTQYHTNAHKSHMYMAICQYTGINVNM